MIAELGTFSIILALWFSLLLIFSGKLSVRLKLANNFNIAHTAAFSQFFFLGLAMLCLIINFLNNDFTVLFVREHSHTDLPMLYKIGAAWGGHEGSLLLWCLLLSGWTLAVAFFNKLPAYSTGILSTLGLVNCGFILFLLFTSNPFSRDFPSTLITGDDLTPVLQDPGLIFHPPMLYSGYVGFAVAFAFTVSALLKKDASSQWARACRLWIIIPWAFLSVGIVLGSWWAYRELGWGGWWFWDPVENASLLPWLAATALLHSLIVTEKRDCFKGWTILLAILTFALSLIGTFLVRSGVLVSVHAFASDPSRGIFLLLYLTIIIGGALFLYGSRIKYFYRPPQFSVFSRETLLLVNTIILITAVITIVLGTLYPIILDSLNLSKISVGEPYFNIVMTPLFILMIFFMGFAPHISWRQHNYSDKNIDTIGLIIVSGILAIATLEIAQFKFFISSIIGIALCYWLILSTTQYIFSEKNQWHLKNWSMIIAHLGIAILALGITINKSYSEERQVKIHPGETVQLAGYQFKFNNVKKKAGENYQSLSTNFSVKKNNKTQRISAELRLYSHDQILAKTGITFNLWRDLYIALGNPLSDGSWTVRIYYKPLVRWIWAGGFILLFGALISFYNLVIQSKIQGRIKL